MEILERCQANVWTHTGTKLRMLVFVASPPPPSRQPEAASMTEPGYLLKTAVSVLASTVRLRVSFMPPFITVSVTLSVLSTSSSPSELASMATLPGAEKNTQPVVTCTHTDWDLHPSVQTHPPSVTSAAWRHRDMRWCAHWCLLMTPMREKLHGVPAAQDQLDPQSLPLPAYPTSLRWLPCPSLLQLPAQGRVGGRTFCSHNPAFSRQCSHSPCSSGLSTLASYSFLLNYLFVVLCGSFFCPMRGSHVVTWWWASEFISGLRAQVKAHHLGLGFLMNETGGVWTPL